jgi:RND family efflux transporter MFP subunit
MRRTIIIGAVVGGVVIAAGLIYFLVIRPGGGAGQPAPGELRRADAESGEVNITISAAGTVQPEQTANLFFPANVLGVVEGVRVGVGDRVRQFEPLARIAADGLRIGREQAVISYEIQELMNLQFVEPPSDNDLLGARADVGAASVRLTDASTVDPELLEIQRLQAQQAVHAYRAADINYKGLQWRSLNDGANAHAQAGIAWVQSEIARLEYEQMAAGPREEDVAVASAEVGLAAAQLRQAEAAPSELAVEQNDIRLERAQIAVDIANEQLADATLRAPFDGVVAAVNVKEGTPPPTLSSAIELVDDSQFHIDVEVDEIDISQVEVGQPVFVEMDALPDRTLTGTVTSIAPSAVTDTGGVVSYIVRVDLDPTDAPLLSGMTATVDIVVEQLEGVLRIPNWAIRIDRRTGDAFVSIQTPDEGLVEVNIELGLRGDAYSEVVSGLEPGQEVVVSLDREDVSLFGGGEE